MTGEHDMKRAWAILTLCAVAVAAAWRPAAAGEFDLNFQSDGTFQYDQPFGHGTNDAQNGFVKGHQAARDAANASRSSSSRRAESTVR
jgi:hypothetical protein